MITILSKLIEERKFFRALFFVGILGVSFHFNGEIFDPHDIVLYVSLIAFSIASIVLGYEYFSNKYYINDLSIQENTHPDYLYAHKILLQSMSRKKFQYLGIYIIDKESKETIALCDRYAKNDFSRNLLNNKLLIFNKIYESSESCCSGVQDLIKSIHPKTKSVNTLRFVYDLHPGGAFVFADPNLIEKKDAPHLLIFGYTNRQSNVNLCMKEMGVLVDSIRKIYGLKPISKVDE